MYVGQTTKSLEYRKKQHINAALQQHNNMYIGRAIKKYGPDNFDWEILHSDIFDIEILNQLEIFYVGYYDTFNSGYNLTEGGGGGVGFKFSEKSRKRMSTARIDKYTGKNHPMYGRHHSEETKRKLSITHSGKNNSNHGKHLSAETRKKISISGKGRIFTDSHKQKIADSQLGKNNSVAKVVMIGINYFNTLNEAAKFLGITSPSLRYRILHQTKWLDYKYK